MTVHLQMELIHGYHATIGDGVRNFRNLIHPNVTLRQKANQTKQLQKLEGKLFLPFCRKEGRLNNRKSKHML